MIGRREDIYWEKKQRRERRCFYVSVWKMFYGIIRTNIFYFEYILKYSFNSLYLAFFKLIFVLS